jgi:glycosyltransferase involved in cell wall biosynthesis
MISILTATYNRAHTLRRLYDSLCAQEVCDFEWIIVDDGSKDETKNLVSEFISDNKFKIIFLQQGNQGKHVALNFGAGHANGEHIFIVDSDDALEVNAISTICGKVSFFPGFLGYCFRKKTFAGLQIGSSIEKDEIVTSPTEAGNLFKGDLAYIFLKSAFLNNPFPRFHGEKFVPELYVWNKISDGGKIIFFPKIFIYICEYLEDGYSHNFKSNLRRNPKGFGVFYKDQISREKNFVRKLKCFIRYSQCLFYKNINI